MTDKNRPRFDELRALKGDRLVDVLRKAVTIAADGEPHLQPCPLSAAAADEISRLRAEVARYREALEFYADPETYHAINIYADPPCGAFRDDFGPHNHWFYEREMPGKRARSALEGGEG